MFKQYNVHWYSVDGFSEGNAVITIYDDGSYFPIIGYIPSCVLEQVVEYTGKSKNEGTAHNFSKEDVRSYEWFCKESE